jgi:hypothetical protein
MCMCSTVVSGAPQELISAIACACINAAMCACINTAANTMSLCGTEAGATAAEHVYLCCLQGSDGTHGWWTPLAGMQLLYAWRALPVVH